MSRLYPDGLIGLLFSLMLVVGGCSDGNTNPEDGGIDGADGGQVECTSAAQCEDENQCTDDTCVQGKCVHTNNTAPCDDGQACSENDVCSDGVCSGTAVGCDDNNPCTNDSCDDTQGCVYIPNSAPCDDDNACTVGDVCSNGSCQGGDAVTCDDGNECTDDECDPVSGCVFTPNNNECDDGQACSSNDHCSNGVCVGESGVDCDDNNPCTEDSCDDSLGCVHSFNIAPCDDENACTENDACGQGSCQGTAMSCNDNNDCTTDSCDPASGCQYENNTDPCDDGDMCTVGDTCSDGACQAGVARDCDDHEPCTDDACVQGIGCTHANNTADCDDGNPCTDGDHCQGGVCVSGQSAFDCDDGDPCTDDSCDPVNGCSHSFNTSPCDDGDSCTIQDTCSNGFCSGTPKDSDSDGYIDENCGGDDCNDNESTINPGSFEGPQGDPICSDGVDNNCNNLTDAQDPGCSTCNNNSDCDDGNVCNGTETCSGGSCVAGSPLNCDDGEICTTDTCDPSSGCQHVNNSASCDDANACTTGDTCSGGSCQPGSGTLTCDDSNPCTDDSCESASGCVFTNNTAPCEDGDQCTTGDTCSGGTCQPGSGTLACDDGNDCTDDSCVSGQGCVYTADDANTCDDQNACTSNDHCSGGTCVGVGLSCDDSNPCTDDTCDPQQGGCVYTNNAATCNDGDACTENDECVGGNCTGTIRDQDGDGYGDGTGACTGDDCDDSDPNINPGAAEACDGIDNNCNRIIDEGCASCDTAVPEGLLQIDNNIPMTSYGLNAGDEAINVFLVQSSSYNAISVDVYFFDFSQGSGNAQGSYSLHIYADDNGLPGSELASAGPDTVTDAWDVAHTFTLSSPVGFTKGELLWVGVRSEQDQTTNLFLPLMDGGIADAYNGGVLKQQSDGQYYGTAGNWLIRVRGCGDGPWLELSDHSESQPVLPAGGSVTSTATLQNRGFDDATSVSGVLSVDASEMVLTSDTASFGSITKGATATGSPAYGISADATAYGIYGMVLDSSDGPNSWSTAYGVYVQGSGCSAENHVLSTDNDIPTYIVAPGAGDETGNYFVVDSTSFAMTSAVVSFIYNNSSGSASGDFRLKVYTYRAGYPDKEIYQSGWQSVTAPAGSVTTETFTLATPLTFKNGDTYFVTVESQNDLSSTDFAVLADDGDTENNSWMNGYFWDDSEGTWSPTYSSFIIKVNGCQSTELSYDSMTSSPDPIQKGQSATLNITIKNDGAQDATGVTGTLSSSDPDVTVTTATRTFGTVSAGSTATANGFVINVAASADAFQYVLDLEMTDGTTTWTDQVPVQLAGGTKNIEVQNFTATLVGNDIQYHWDVVNTGNVDILDAFHVDLYVDRATAPGVGDAGDWSDSPASLSVGESRPYDLTWQDAPTGSYNAWVQADTNDDIAESDETDNIAGPQSTSVGDSTTFELLNPPRKWFASDMPVGFRFVANNYEHDLDLNSTRDAIRTGFDQWQNVATAAITFQELSQASSGSGGFIDDGYNTMSFEDPDGELATGVLGATLPLYNGQTTTTNNVTFYRMYDADIVFNDGVPFVRNGDPCSNQMDLDGVATHEEGHLLGLDHPDVFNATMYYAVDYCDMSKVSLAESDINGVTFIYPQ